MVAPSPHPLPRILVVTYDSSDGPAAQLKNWFDEVQFDNISVHDAESEPIHVYDKIRSFQPHGIILYIPKDPKTFKQMLFTEDVAFRTHIPVIVTHNLSSTTINSRFTRTNRPPIVPFFKKTLESFVNDIIKSRSNKSDSENNSALKNETGKSDQQPQPRKENSNDHRLESTQELLKVDMSQLFLSGKYGVIESSAEFWFDKARKKLSELRSIDFVSYDLEKVVEDLMKGEDSFLVFMNKQTGVLQRILKQVGELIAYVDYNGKNKNIWNEYEDKRAIAPTGIRQKTFASNILRYIAGQKEPSSKGVANILAYLTEPAIRIPIISERHKSLIAKSVLNLDYIREVFDQQILSWFGQLPVKARNEENFPVICMLLLYEPSIRAYWDPSKTELDDDLLEGAENKPDDTPPVEYHSYQLKGRIHSDQTAEKDSLEYRQYARTIAKMITDDRTKPPVNIAIIAPWGHGKSTMMEFIREELEHRDKWKIQKTGKYSTTIKTLRIQLNKWLDHEPQPIPEEIKSAKSTEAHKENPTVWFNPWKYQSSEQIWAGMGHSIITQLVGKHTPEQQELIWLRIRLKRIDREKIRKEIHKRILGLWGIKAVCMAFGILCLFTFIPFLEMNVLVKLLTGTVGSLMGGGIVWQSWKKAKEDIEKQTVDGSLADFVREPDYEAKLGAFHHINEDLKLVAEELIDPAKPAVIFIDDLDRCSPKTVWEVFEAVNLMMTGDIKHKCYFVLGMDAQMVAAALDTQYKDWKDLLPEQQKTYGTIGWYFLDKFIQLPFYIPVLNNNRKQKFLSNVLSEDNMTANENEVLYSDAEIKNAAASLYSTMSDDDSDETQSLVREEALKYGKQVSELQEQYIKIAMEKSKDDPNIDKIANKFAVFIDNAPRSIKRFANLLRFYNVHQQARRISSSPQEQSEFAATETLAKWLVINLRWPQMVRWVQWEHEDILLYSSDPEEKAGKMDELLNNDDAKISYENWKSMLDKLNQVKEQKRLAWLYDRDLYDLLSKNSTVNSQLTNAIRYNVW
jgi:hypothetical protein